MSPKSSGRTGPARATSSSHLAAVAVALDRRRLQTARLPRIRLAPVVERFNLIAHGLTGEFGGEHFEARGSEALSLFTDTDRAVDFALHLIARWRAEVKGSARLGERGPLPIVAGCHFGECTRTNATFFGRGIDLARTIAGSAEPDSIVVTETVLDLLDLPRYEIREAGQRALAGDHLPARSLYWIAGLAESDETDDRAEPTAEEWFARGAAIAESDQKNGPDEVRAYSEALRLRPDYPEAHTNLGAIYASRNDFERAEAHYRAALDADPDFGKAHFNYAVMLQTRGNLLGARRHYQEALAVSPDYVDAHFGLANLLRGMGEPDSARAHYARALELRPGYAEVLCNLASLFEDEGNFAEADREYRAAVSAAPAWPEGHYNLGLFLENQGQLKEAERHYREAIKLRPSLAEARNNLSVLLLLRGGLDEAESHLRAALEAKPDDPIGHFNYALVMRSRGNQTAAASHLNSAMEHAPREWAERLSKFQGAEMVSPAEAGLTRREMTVLRLIAQGASNRDIAAKLHLSESTVAHHVTAILQKTGANNRTQAAWYAVHHGLLGGASL